MNIFGLARSEGACDFYRLRQPLEKLLQHKLAITKIEDGHSPHEKIIKGMEGADVIMFPRPDSREIADYIKLVRKKKTIIIDHDDDVFNVSPFSEHYAYFGTKPVNLDWTDGKDPQRLWYDGMTGQDNKVYFDIEANIERQKWFIQCLKRCHLVTVTTPHLRLVYKKYNHRVQVLPNLIDLNRFKKLPLIKTDEVRLLWQGGYSHYEDWLEVSEAITEVMQRYPKVKLVCLGQIFWGTVRNIPRNRVEGHGWVQLEGYPLKMASLNADIGICPLRDNVFNRSKSNLKYLEYSALEIPCVASDVENYSNTIHHLQNGYLAKTKQEWVEYLSMLIEDKALRERIGRAAYENVKANWDADDPKNMHAWITAYQNTRR